MSNVCHDWGPDGYESPHDIAATVGCSQQDRREKFSINKVRQRKGTVDSEIGDQNQENVEILCGLRHFLGHVAIGELICDKHHADASKYDEKQ